MGEERHFGCQACLLCKPPSLERRMIVLTNRGALTLKCQVHTVARALLLL